MKLIDMDDNYLVEMYEKAARLIHLCVSDEMVYHISWT